MSAGDFDFGGTFRLDPSGESDDAEEIPFPPISYIVWLLFVIIMPILLTNMLVCNMHTLYETQGCTLLKACVPFSINT